MGKAQQKEPVILSRREAIRQKCASTGKEFPDQTPVHIPGDCQKPLSLREEMRRFVREELSKAAAKQDVPTFEEEDDFEEENPELDMLTQYTVHELGPEQGQPVDDLEGSPTPEDINPPAELALGGEAAEAEGETPAPAPVEIEAT